MSKRRKHMKVNSNGAVIIMSGISGSGKSTLSSQLKTEIGPDKTRIISSDRVRSKLLPEDIDHETELNNYKQRKWTKERIDDMMIQELQLGLNHDKVNIIDATNLSEREQSKFAKVGKKYDVPVITIKLTTRIEEAKKRNSKRTRKVPNKVIEDMEKKRISKGDQPSKYVDEVIEIDGNKKIKKRDLKKVVTSIDPNSTRYQLRTLKFEQGELRKEYWDLDDHLEYLESKQETNTNDYIDSKKRQNEVEKLLDSVDAKEDQLIKDHLSKQSIPPKRSFRSIPHKLNSYDETIDFDVSFHDTNFVAYAEDSEGNTKLVAGNVPDPIEDVDVEEIDEKLIITVESENEDDSEMGEKYTIFIDETKYD